MQKSLTTSRMQNSLRFKQGIIMVAAPTWSRSCPSGKLHIYRLGNGFASKRVGI